KKEMIESARSVGGVLKDPEPAVYFRNFGDSSLDLLLIFWVDNYTTRFGAEDKINLEINRRFAEAGIEIPFPIRTVINAPTEEAGPKDEKKVKRKAAE
ncbi:MAG: mechanosensitive ion channel, partial [Proteobacteria bacterium]|nr:mechanosensitive ion channel [Pseudomonadota bacterium]